MCPTPAHAALRCLPGGRVACARRPRFAREGPLHAAALEEPETPFRQGFSSFPSIFSRSRPRLSAICAACDFLSSASLRARIDSAVLKAIRRAKCWIWSAVCESAMKKVHSTTKSGKFGKVAHKKRSFLHARLDGNACRIREGVRRSQATGIQDRGEEKRNFCTQGSLRRRSSDAY